MADPPVHRILVIDDNNADIALIKLALQTSTLATELTFCKDGEEAIRFLQSPTMQALLDAIILDLGLPKVDGFEVLHEIVSSPGCAGIPVMVFTSLQSPTDQHRVELLPSCRYVQKPSTLAGFFQAVIENVQSMLTAEGKAKSESV